METVECRECRGEFDTPRDEKFCCPQCEALYRSKRRTLEKGGRLKEGGFKTSRSIISSFAPNSPLGQLDDLYNSMICTLCYLMGAVSIEEMMKERGKPFCSHHISRPPSYFKCSECYERFTKQVVCCGKITEGKWYFSPNFPSHLKQKPKVPKWMLAHLAQGQGKERALEMLERVAETLNLGSAQEILEGVKCARDLEGIWREELTNPQLVPSRGDWRGEQ